MICSICDEPSPDGARFCVSCGIRLGLACVACHEVNQPSARFCAGCGSRLSSPETAGPFGPRHDAERRPLTVVFCDMVAPTSLAARLDPEDLRMLMNRYLTTVTETVQRFDGFVAGFRGDGLKVFFGWPRADETDAERAVRAGLAAIAAVAQAGFDADPPTVRVGIATGLVIVGDLPGAGAGPEDASAGQTPSLAARLQAVARPGSVVVDAATYRLISGLFDTRNLGTLDLRGLPAPVPAWRILGELPVRDRFEARHMGGTGPLIDRDEDLEMLMRRWRQARDGEGRMVLVSGDPGIGKSRLIVALQAAVGDEPHLCRRYFYSPHHQGTALHPVISQMGQSAGFLPGDPPETKLDKLLAEIEDADPSPEEISLLTELLSIPGGTRFPPIQISPQRKKERTFAAMLRTLGVREKKQPILLLCEDAQWADPSSIEFLDLLVEHLPRMRILLVVTFRPEFRPPWVGRDGVTQWSMSRLDRRGSARLTRQVLGDRQLPSGLLDRIVAQADGVPLFIEELTKALVESMEQAGGTGEVLGVPATLQASLLARLDRLPAAKRAAQIGAVIGRGFSHALLSAAMDPDTAELDRGLRDLVDAGLVFQRGAGPDAVYIFKHAMVRDVAYESLLSRTRRDLHARVAKVLEHQPQAASAQPPEVLAYHCDQAGRAADAIRYYRLAARSAGGSGGVVEEQTHLLRALELSENLPAGPGRARIDAELRLALGGLSFVTALPGAPDPAMYASAVEACRRIGDQTMLIQALWGHWGSQVHARGPAAAGVLAHELARLAEEQADPQLRKLAASALMTHEFAQGRALNSIAIATPVLMGQRPRRPSLSGEAIEPEVYLRSSLGIANAVSGAFAGSARESALALALARDLKHFSSLALAMSFGMHRLWLIGDLLALRALAEEFIAVCEVHHVPRRAGRARAYLEWLDGRTGARKADLGVFQAFVPPALILFGPCGLLQLADVVAGAGDSGAAIGYIDDGLDVARASGEIWLEAELLRRRGQLLLAAGNSYEEAEILFSRSLELARGRGQKLFEVRTSVSLARLWSDTGLTGRACELLAGLATAGVEGAGVEGAGVEGAGFDGPPAADLIEAAGLLRSLSH